jgi:hypothetical protein
MAELAERAAAAGLRLEGVVVDHEDGVVTELDAPYRLVDADTGTLVAADWSTPHGVGLGADQVAAALDIAETGLAFRGDDNTRSRRQR